MQVMPDQVQSQQRRPRVRAARACRRCSQRKTSCEGAGEGVSCARCRRDNIADCIFVPSRRGRYIRKDTMLPRDNNIPQFSSEEQWRLPSQSHSRYLENCLSISDSNSDLANFPSVSVGALTAGDQTNLATGPEFPPATIDTSGTISATKCLARNHADRQVIADDHVSLASMFGRFLSCQKPGWDGPIKKRNIVFLGEASPLTFALEEFHGGERSSLHKSVDDFLQPNQDDADTAEPRQTHHPSHMQLVDINYLKMKGAFQLPEANILEALVRAFLERFHPLHSIVNEAEFEKSFQQQKVPWILLQAVCFIGASYCEQEVIRLSGFSGRWPARKTFFDKAKLLFDVGYETNKVVLLQVVLLLSFRGPEMKSYWNPCSWVGFAMTIAESLGIHQTTTSAYLEKEERGLLRRLWWTLASRDAYCAALLGRPFRINTAQCDTEMLVPGDFEKDMKNTTQSPSIGSIYQIQNAKLSLISRRIVATRVGSTASSSPTEELHAMLDDWLAQLPRIVDWQDGPNTSSVFVISLKVIYYHQLILVYLGKPSKLTDAQNVTQPDTVSTDYTEFAARMILSTAIPLGTNSMVSQVPQEVLSGFFMAGIVFYRHVRQGNTMSAQLGRAALDNCRSILHEAREHWDASQWVLQIFEFLLSMNEHVERVKPACSSDAEHNHDAPGCSTLSEETIRTSHDDENLYHVDIESLFEQILGDCNDSLIMPNYLAPMDGGGHDKSSQ